MIPHAHTSPGNALAVSFFDKISGGIYFSVPQSSSGLNLSATPLIPKSATFILFSLLKSIFSNFKSL